MNAKKRALGKGLGALLQDPSNDITSRESSGRFSVGNIADISIDMIEANPFQPRDKFEEETLNELAESIREQGIIQPVTVRKLGHDKFQLISGERRLKAAKLAGLEVIPAFIRIADDQQMLELALVENIQREDLNAIEVAISYQRLMDECKLTQDKLSSRVGKNRATIANYVRLLRLPPELQIAIRDKRISMGHARALINIEDEDTQLAILKNILIKDLSVREVEAIVRNLNKEDESAPRKVQAIPKNFREAVLKMGKTLGMKMSVTRTANGKGSLTIRFNSDEEFRKIESRLKS